MSKMTLTYTSDNGREVTFGGPPFVLTAVDGLYGLTADIHGFSQYLQDGITYVASQLQQKTITIRAQILTNIVANRIELLRAVDPKSQGTITLRRDGLVRQHRCVVEQAPSFNPTRGDVFSVTLVAPGPYWEPLTETRTDIAVWEAGFEWPLDIPIATGIEFGFRTTSQVVNVYNDGDADAGMRVVFKANGELSTPSIVSVTDPNRYIRVNTGLHAGDTAEVSTKPGGKYARITRAGGAPQNAFALLDPHCDLSLMIKRGDNLYRYEAVSGEGALDVTVYFQAKYLGV